MVILANPPDKEVPTGLCLDFEALQTFPSAVLASNIEAQTPSGMSERCNFTAFKTLYILIESSPIIYLSFLMSSRPRG
jgi:hypothetical protein